MEQIARSIELPGPPGPGGPDAAFVPLPPWLHTAPVALPDDDTDDHEAIGVGVQYVNWWSLLTDADCDELTRPRGAQPGPCFFCGGRTTHSQMCIDQRRRWIVLPHGKHKDKSIVDVPRDYLRWFLRKVRRAAPEVRDEICRVLNVDTSDNGYHP